MLWCISRPDLIAPALAQAGLTPNRVIYVEAHDEKGVLACFEEGLRHGGLGAVVGEVAKLSMTASRRLQLAAETGGTIGIAIRRWRRQTEASDFGQPTASVTRWRVSALPSSPLPVPGVGRARWLVELIRCRAGESALQDHLALLRIVLDQRTQAATARQVQIHLRGTGHGCPRRGHCRRAADHMPPTHHDHCSLSPRCPAYTLRSDPA